MPEEPNQPPAPRPVIPIEHDPDQTLDAEIIGEEAKPATPPAPLPVMPIAEPGVTPPAPFAQVYAPPPTVAPPAYYPPAYPPPAGYPPSYPPAGSPPPPAYPPPSNYPPAWPDPVDYRGTMVRSYSRPGIVTTIAVTAIIVAALSLISSFFTGCTSMMIMNSSRKTTSAPRTAGIPGPVVVAPVPQSANALSESDRNAVMKALRAERFISDERTAQLDAFLRENGKTIFDDGGGGISMQDVTKCLGGHGQEFSTGGKNGPTFFIFKSSSPCKLPGRLRLFDDRAVYKPDDYSPDLRSSHKLTAESQTPDPQPIATGGLDIDQVRAIVGVVQNLSSNHLNPAQSNSLTSLLQAPTYGNWLQDASTIPGLTAQVKSAVLSDDGSIVITFTMGKLTLDAQGNMVGPMPVIPAPTTMPANPMGPAWAMGTLSADHNSCSMGFAEAFLSGLLAIYLLVIAIMSLKQNPIGRKFYFIYIAIKVIACIIAIVAFTGIINSLNASSGPSIARSASNFFSGTASAALVFSVIGLAYPIIILLVLTLNKSARDYYKSTT